ncbi:MAG: ABC transporter permease [Nitrososphaerota archaeon]|nr:ABC transporter permease [Nitrososphaerota archaeon]MDG6954447.1 ABC transporter permease [Nitrososphaerota archaeon]
MDIVFGNPATLVGVGILVVFLALSLLAAWPPTYHLLARYDPYSLNFGSSNNSPPSLAHLFGTDKEGRDIFARVLAALPVDIAIPFEVVGASVAIGLLLGTFGGYLGGWVEELVLRVTDLFFAFPSIVLALAISAILGAQATGLRVYYSELALIIVGWPFYTRLARAEVIALKQMPFVRAAEASGLGKVRIIRTHIIPHLASVVAVYATLDMGTVLLLYSVFAFFGLGQAPPTPELGRMVYDGLSALPGDWWWSFFPGLFLMILALGFSLAGEGLRDVFDPRLRGER